MGKTEKQHREWFFSAGDFSGNFQEDRSWKTNPKPGSPQSNSCSSKSALGKEPQGISKGRVRYGQFEAQVNRRFFILHAGSFLGPAFQICNIHSCPFSVCNEDPIFEPSALEFAVAVLPLTARWDLFNRVPVFSDLAIGHAEQVIERYVLSAESTLADCQNKVTFT